MGIGLTIGRQHFNPYNRSSDTVDIIYTLSSEYITCRIFRLLCSPRYQSRNLNFSFRDLQIFYNTRDDEYKTVNDDDDNFRIP